MTWQRFTARSIGWTYLVAGLTGLLWVFLWAGYKVWFYMHENRYNFHKGLLVITYFAVVMSIWWLATWVQRNWNHKKVNKR